MCIKTAINARLKN